jgi:16S rRNA (guanine527-N7)-methyltransferase
MTLKIPTNPEIAATLLRYGVSATPKLCDQVRRYLDLLLRWNKKISLTTVTDSSEIIRFHFGESLFAAKSVPVSHSRLADVGSGAGFPGLALKLILEDVEIVLIESNAKKAAFLSEVTRELGLKDVEVFRGRMEDYEIGSKPLGLITARALGQHAKFLAWSHTKLKSDGIVALWLGEDDARAISRSTSWSWHEPIKIPESERRFILFGSPTG